MQLRLDAADRLVELVEERRGPVYVEEAARRLFALRQAPVAMARSLLEEVVGEDARLAWRGDAVGLADPPGADIALERATFVVVDLETTGLRPGSSQICEIGAVRVAGFEIVDQFETLVDPRERLSPIVSSLTGLSDRMRGIDRKLCRGGGQVVAHSSDRPQPQGSSTSTFGERAVL